MLFKSDWLSFFFVQVSIDMIKNFSQGTLDEAHHLVGSYCQWLTITSTDHQTLAVDLDLFRSVPWFHEEVTASGVFDNRIHT